MKSAKWKVLESKELYTTRMFSLRTDRCETAKQITVPNYYVIEFPSWCNVVPVTEDGQVVLVKQYRHAVGEVTLEIPGGMVDAHEENDVYKAATRELREETGYTCADIQLTSKHWPNPAIQNNIVHNFVATGCRLVHEPDPDPFEDIEVETCTIPELIKHVHQGRIKHSIVVAAIFGALPFLNK